MINDINNNNDINSIQPLLSQSIFSIIKKILPFLHEFKIYGGF